MKSIATFRHNRTEGAGYFSEYLDQQAVPWQVIKLDEGTDVPQDSREFSGLAFMGGPMSVNDPLPWIPPVLALIQHAVSHGVPVIGHCLGGQLLCRALGGRVVPNPVPEIGWHAVESIAGVSSRAWLGSDTVTFDAFHWHNETFSIPPGATQLLIGRNCVNQAYVLGPHIGMQCHVEMTPDMILTWCRDWHQEGHQATATVQTPEHMCSSMDQRLAAMRLFTDRIYGRWLEGVSARAA